MNPIDEKILAWFWRHKDTIIGCLKQSDASWVYDTDETIEELNKIFGEEL